MQKKEVFEKGREVVISIYIYTIDLFIYLFTNNTSCLVSCCCQFCYLTKLPLNSWHYCCFPGPPWQSQNCVKNDPCDVIKWGRWEEKWERKPHMDHFWHNFHLSSSKWNNLFFNLQDEVISIPSTKSIMQKISHFVCSKIE